MKKINSSFVLLSILLLASCDTPRKQKNENSAIQNKDLTTINKIENAETITQWARWRKRNKCEVRGGGCMIAISDKEARSLKNNEKSSVRLKLLNDSTMLASYIEKVDTRDENFMYFSNNTTLDPTTSKVLNKKEIIIISGEYKLDFGDNKFGSAIVNVIVK